MVPPGMLVCPVSGEGVAFCAACWLKRPAESTERCATASCRFRGLRGLPQASLRLELLGDLVEPVDGLFARPRWNRSARWALAPRWPPHPATSVPVSLRARRPEPHALACRLLPAPRASASCSAGPPFPRRPPPAPWRHLPAPCSRAASPQLVQALPRGSGLQVLLRSPAALRRAPLLLLVRAASALEGFERPLQLARDGRSIGLRQQIPESCTCLASASDSALAGAAAAEDGATRVSAPQPGPAGPQPRRRSSSRFSRRTGSSRLGSTRCAEAAARAICAAIQGEDNECSRNQ